MPVMCYICGRDFGTRSIKIHIPQCVKKWDNEQSKLPASRRRPPPSAPENFEKVVSGEIKGQALKQFNDSTMDDWNKSALEPCPNCARTFLPKSLEVHLRSCKRKSPVLEEKPAPRRRMTVPATSSRSVRPGTYTKSNNNQSLVSKGGNGDSDGNTVSREAIIAIIQKDEALNMPDKRRELMNFLVELCRK